MSYTPRWQRHKLTPQEGLRKLYHIMEYLESLGEHQAAAIVRALIHRMLKGHS